MKIVVLYYNKIQRINRGSKMKYVTCERSHDINKANIYTITIHKVPKIECEYSLSFKNHDEYKLFENANKSFIGVGAEVRFGKARESERYIIKINMKHDDGGFNKCVLILRASDWVCENIDKIVDRLTAQAENFSKRAQVNQSGFNRQG